MLWGGILIAAVLLLAARPSLAWWARRTAATHLQAGRVSHAEQWLKRSAGLNANSVATQVLIARSHRHLNQQQQWQEAIERAQAKDSASDALHNEKRLGALQWGEVAKISKDERERLVESGVDNDEAALAVAHALVLAGDDRQLERLLKEWEETTDVPQQPAFIRGIHRQAAQDWSKARSHLQTALEQEPAHEMAHAAMAQVLEQANDFDAALEYFASWTQFRPDNEQAATGWSRMLRYLSRADEARDVMQQFAPAIEVSAPVALEWAEVELALGNFEEASRWFRLADLGGPHYSSTLRRVATAFALSGDTIAAEAMFERVMNVQDRQRRIEELQKRVVNDPSDRKAAEALQKVVEQPTDAPVTSADTPDHPISRLFSEHCASCHGQRGDANGPGSRHLYPPARNLRTDRYRLVTGRNRQPRLADIEAVIRDGIPGTAMPSFADLPDSERGELAQQVYQLRQEGMRSELLEQFRNVGETADEEAIGELVRQRLAAAEPLAVPETPDLSSASQIADGRQVYEQSGCVQCHGPDGRGAFDVPLFNDDGSHAVPRDLVGEPWKSGGSPEALFARLRLGMPGTPHPENPTLDDEQLMSLVAYCLSLSSDSKTVRTNRQRAILANERAIQARFGEER